MVEAAAGVEAERFRPAPGRHAGVGARVHGGAHQVRASAGKQWACACRTGAPSWPCHRRLMAACFFGFFLRSNVGIEKNTSAQTVKQSNAGGGTRSIGACTQLLYWLHALDCLSRSTLTRPGNQGGEHRSFGRRGAPWHPGDACTPGQATRELCGSRGRARGSGGRHARESRVDGDETCEMMFQASVYCLGVSAKPA